jgi:endonuclease/exonuclease/phosphatase family metal-dependent hydrolase
VATGPESSLAVRGTLQPVPLEHGDYFMAVARLAPRRHPGASLLVVSTHFTVRGVNLDLWRRAAWQAAEGVVRGHNWQMGRVRHYAEPALAQGPAIVGGDFNTPGGDALFRALRPHFRDCFAVAGQGWPDTITNDYPASRID